jgi:hypothetical protein
MADRISFDLLRTEAEAFPWSSPLGLELCLGELERDASGQLQGGTSALAAALNEQLRVHAGGLALESLAQLRDHAWFGDGGAQRISLAEGLSRLARSYLESAGDRVVLARGHARLELSMRWRWLTFRLPADLLVAAAFREHECCPPMLDVEPSSPHLTELLTEAPVAETHVHAGNALRFDMLWSGLMAQLASGNVADRLGDNLVGPCLPPPFGADARERSGGSRRAEFVRFLYVGSLARLVLAQYLMDPRSASVRDAANEIDERCGRPATTGPATRACQVLTREAPELPSRGELERALVAVAASAIARARVTRSAAHAALLDLAVPGRQLTAGRSRFEEVVARDPLAWFAPAHRDRAELWLTHASLRALEYGLPGRRVGNDFVALFWQYVRVRCLMYGHLTQDPGVAGLDWFREFSGRLGPLRRTLDSRLPELALRTLSRGNRLSALELRLSPPRDRADLRESLLSLLAELRVPRRNQPQVGIIVHFLKGGALRAARGSARLHADPATNLWSYGAWYQYRMREAALLESFLTRHPESLVLIRGVDVASTELSIPTFAVIGPIQSVRRASVATAARLALAFPEWNTPPLRVTCHAGEDYRRLVEGLRRVHELIEFNVIGQGDRIGHGLALGHSPELWMGGARVAYQPRGERLNDLVWELDAYGRGYLGTDGSRVELVRREIADLAHGVLGCPVPAEMLVEARRRLHDANHLRRIGFPTHIAPGDTVDRLLINLLCDSDLAARARAPMMVEATGAELCVIRELQAYLCKRIGQLEITVESNPTSNLLIGSYARLEDHPAFRLCPLQAGAGRVLLSINSDDPLTFATCTCDEYAHVYHALLRKGVDAHQALEWLRQVRDNGYRSRFTLSTSADRSVLETIENSLRNGSPLCGAAP